MRRPRGTKTRRAPRILRNILNQFPRHGQKPRLIANR